MRISFSTRSFLILTVSVFTASAQTAIVPPPTPYSIVHRETNERTWRRTKYISSPSGQIVSQAESYREVGNCICFHSQNGWQDSENGISILPDGSGASTNAPCKIFIPPDIYNGLVKIVTADGLELESEPIGLWFTDNAATVQIAALTNSVGELISSNAVLFPGAFVGAVKADLLLTVRNSGLEQDAIIRSQPAATPQQLGLDSANTKLQLVTEFVNSPTPVQNVGPVNPQDGLQDTALTFGSMRMTEGQAFQTGAGNAGSLQNRIRVYKSWTTTPDGRELLIEQVPYQRVSAQLTALPRSASRSSTRSGGSILRRASPSRLLPPRRSFKATANSLQLHGSDFKAKPGLDIDFVTVDSAETNMTFAADSTYLVNTSGGAGYYLYGTTTIEGGAVIKFPNDSGDEGSLIIDQNGTLNCQTAEFRPGLLTSMDDNEIGQTVSGSSGTPAYDDNLWCLQINGTNVSIHDLRFCYAWVGIGQNAAEGQETTINATNCQFIDGDIAVHAYNANLYNVLIGRSTNEDAAIWTEGPNLVGENITADGGNAFVEADYAGASVALTNCLVTGQPLLTSGGSVTLSTNAVACVLSPSVPVYETVGGESYYLTNASPYREAGTANIDPALLADLAERTTWPPIVYDRTNISSLGTLGPQARRDTNSAPDIGYHWDCLDYAFGGCDLYSNLTFSTGAAVGWFEDGDDPNSGQPYSISLNSGANLSFDGSATRPGVYARYTMVQEGGNGNWTGEGWMGGLEFKGGILSADFTKFISDDWNGNTFRDDGGGGEGSFRNCEIYSLGISTYGMSALTFTNCLFFRLCQSFWTSPNLTYVNCTFFNGGMDLYRSSPVSWLFENCSFDGTAFDGSDSYNGTSYTTINYNAYNTNNFSWQTYPLYGPYTNTLEVVGSDDVMVTNYNWQAGPLEGDFYLPGGSPLIYVGSTNANLLGLYHYTTTTNLVNGQEVPDGTNIVTIGYHFVATDQYGNPLDSNGDGVPDYLEDPAGNGTGNWDNTAFLNVIISQPQNGSTVP